MKTLPHTFPIDEALPRLRDAIASSRTVILTAPPGAGKTTRVPLALLDEPWLSGRKVLMLEPRRLAARRSAEFMSSLLNERTGETVGYRIRGEAQVGPRTRIEVVTEGILTRMLHRQPDLPETGIIIFDEFHERSIHADLGLAFALDVQRHLRNDLKVLVMSATLDSAALSGALDNAPIVESAGRAFPVETRYRSASHEKFLEVRCADAVARALKEEEGDVLVFLPGQREIRRTESALFERHLPDNVIVQTLHGEAAWSSQLSALSPAPDGKRKVILSTNIAETSLTIEGVRVVVDAGLVRISAFDPRRGMAGLKTVGVSRASADQRRGRAGRVAPGICYRLWSESEHAQLPDRAQPEIKTADLAPLTLDLEAWGSPMGEGLTFLDPPPLPHLQQARALLQNLGALDADGKITPFGTFMSDLPIHPRLAAMVLRGKEMGCGGMACDLAAMLEDRDLFSGEKDADIDLASRWQTLKAGRGAVRERVVEQSRRLRDSLGIRKEKESEDHLGLLLALAYPDRIGRRKGTEGNKYLLTSGMTGVLPARSLLGRHEFLAVGDVDGAGAEVKIFLAAPVTQDQLTRVFGDRLVEEDEVRWSSPDRSVRSRSVTRLGAVVLAERSIDPRDERSARALLDGVREMGMGSLPWTKDSRALVERSEWLRRTGNGPTGWPDLSDEALVGSIDEWLLPFLGGMWRGVQLASIDMSNVIRARFSHVQLQDLDRTAPSHVQLPSGSRIALDYSSGELPVLSVRLQELFGQSETPRVAGGRVPVVLQILSPARRPLAVTQDLGSFWKNVYPEIRTSMRARYPRHFWPENPLTAAPTSKPLRRGRRH